MTLRLHLCLVPDLLRENKRSIHYNSNTSNNGTNCNESPKRDRGKPLLEQVIPILFRRVRVVAIDKTNCLASAILASVPTLGMALESVQVTVIVESDRVFVACSVTQPEPVPCRSQTSLQDNTSSMSRSALTTPQHSPFTPRQGAQIL
jgi:hypothetical protein